MLQNARQQSVASSIAIGKSRRDVEKTDSLTDMDRTDHSLVALRRILRATELYGRDLAQEAGLTAVQLRVLQIIGETDHSTPSEIATRMGVSQATISVLLNKLEGYGLIARQKSRADRRQTDLQITAKGRAKVEVAPDALQQRYVAQFEALPDWEQSMIVSVLERVAGMLDAGTIDAAPVLTGGELLRNGRG
jgi:DNA-binding MarR family transcriptional regulator